MTAADDSDLLARAHAWAGEDPDEHTRSELRAALAAAESGDAAAMADLTDRFTGRLTFGTAGLRGALGAGPRRMNRVVVSQAAAGLIQYLLDTLGGDGHRPRVVIGFDARYRSDAFAADTAQIVQGAGGQALLLPAPLPTPVLAYAIRALGCDAGVMVTASHNPPQDNGYKVYLGDGSQIVPPADAAIAAAIDQAAAGALSAIPRDDGYTRLGEEVRAAYQAAVVDTVEPGPRALRVVHTSLHGVGGELVAAVLAQAGFGDVRPVPEQEQPDPDFPTVPFPNPEEPGAMDLALALAAEVGADLVVANDPDTDRCAVAVPDGAPADAASGSASGGWRMLSGDEVGILLADALLRSGRSGTYATTIVSSSLLSELVTARGAELPARPEVTLTGFKWLTKVDALGYAYEEALGYCVAPDLVLDKDGISAALLVCHLAAAARARGESLVDRLDELARAHGLYATGQLSVRVDDVTEIADAMARLRAEPPSRLGGFDVEQVEDLATGSVETTGLPPTDGLRLTLAEQERVVGRVVVRPSGTEPKLKAYLEVVVGVGDEADGVQAARIAAAGRLDAVRGDLAAALGL